MSQNHLIRINLLKRIKSGLNFAFCYGNRGYTTNQGQARHFQ